MSQQAESSMPCSPPPAPPPRWLRLPARCVTMRSTPRCAIMRAGISSTRSGVMISGAEGEVATRAEATLARLRPSGSVPVPGRARRADLFDAAFLGGGPSTASDSMTATARARCIRAAPCCRRCCPAGYAMGASGVRRHRSDGRWVRDCDRDCARLPSGPCASAALIRPAPARYRRRRGGRQAPRICAGSASPMRSALPASSAAGLFAFVNGGADIKRLHAGHASREGLQAALPAEQGMQGRRASSNSATASCRPSHSGAIDKARPIALPPAVSFGITDCYIKPYACCRQIQPAVEALIGLCTGRSGSKPAR